MREYTIWGIPPRETEETLLVSMMPDGKPITDEQVAKKLAAVCEKRGATQVRISVFHPGEAEFMKSFEAFIKG